jgi:hypothetical protein
MYIKNVEGFGGQGDFLSKFNLEIRDQVTFTIARRTFNNEIGAYTTFERPREGDLIYFPLNNKFFEIKFVEHEAIFYQLGALQTFDLSCELFEYSNELFNTGIDLIDSKYPKLSLDVNLFGSLLTEDSLNLTDEQGLVFVEEGYDFSKQDPIADNDEIQAESDDILDFSEFDPFSEGAY